MPPAIIDGPYEILGPGWERFWRRLPSIDLAWVLDAHRPKLKSFAYLSRGRIVCLGLFIAGEEPTPAIWCELSGPRMNDRTSRIVFARDGSHVVQVIRRTPPPWRHYVGNPYGEPSAVNGES